MLDRVQIGDRARSGTIGGVRILAGLLWLANVHWKVPGDFGENNGGGLYKYTKSGAANAPFAPFRWLLREIVVPNFHLFGWFTLISETVLAALLLIGYRTRLVALAGAAMSVGRRAATIVLRAAGCWSSDGRSRCAWVVRCPLDRFCREVSCAAGQRRRLLR